MLPNDSVSIINVQREHYMEIPNESEICFQVYFGECNGKPSEKKNKYCRRLYQKESKSNTERSIPRSGSHTQYVKNNQHYK